MTASAMVSTRDHALPAGGAVGSGGADAASDRAVTRSTAPGAGASFGPASGELLPVVSVAVGHRGGHKASGAPGRRQDLEQPRSTRGTAPLARCGGRNGRP